MSWSLKIRKGDLALGGSSLGTVTNEQKLVQDLRCALLEPAGSDPSHPEYGSTLDGGVVEGRYVEGVIGMSDPATIRSKVEAEIRRVAKAHQESQIRRVTLDKSKYGTSTLTAGELLRDITNLQIFQVQDTLIVRVTLLLGNKEETIDVPVSGQG